jgi:hypothetical protein
MAAAAAEQRPRTHGTMRRTPRPVRRHVRIAPRQATWVPAPAAPQVTAAQMLRVFADDRRLIRVKLLLLAALVIATAALERVA